MSSPQPNADVKRLKTRKEFLAVASARRKWAMPGMVVQARVREDDSASHVGIGFTASKKVGNAVMRNRTKRRLRACADRIVPVQAKPGMDLVIIGRAGTAKRPFDALSADLRKCLKKLNALRDDV